MFFGYISLGEKEKMNLMCCPYQEFEDSQQCCLHILSLKKSEKHKRRVQRLKKWRCIKDSHLVAVGSLHCPFLPGKSVNKICGFTFVGMPCKSVYEDS